MIKRLIFLIIIGLSISCTRSLSEKNLQKLQGVWYMADGSEFVKIVKGSIDYLPPYGQFSMKINGDTIHYEGIDEDNKQVPHFDELIIKLDKKELKTIGLQSGEQLHWVKKRVDVSPELINH